MEILSHPGLYVLIAVAFAVFFIGSIIYAGNETERVELEQMKTCVENGKSWVVSEENYRIKECR